ncbi:hypothetical protein A4A49_08480 [Nicotiana attenuata]|uniref:Uncharacterized protein n=1 Tax=Nicotiana attenuata TaxID=49451 RepID=A0A1J6IN35_NICAT|nr:hypothetical protein A4A49_08480 [Nicotiana attenuata]
MIMTGYSTLNTTSTRIKVGDTVNKLERVNNSILPYKESRALNGENNSLYKAEVEARRVKKEAVGVANKEREVAHKGNNLNPTPTGIYSLDIQGAKEFDKVSSPIHSEVGIDEMVINESTIEWVHRRFITRKEEQKELHVTTNQSSHEILSQTYEDSGQLEELMRGTLNEPGIHGGSATALLAKNQANGTVNLRNFVEIFAIVNGVPVYALRSEQDRDINMVFEKDTVGSDHQTVDGKVCDLNGRVFSGNSSIVNPSLGYVYELQFKMMPENLGIMERNSKINEVSLWPRE